MSDFLQLSLLAFFGSIIALAGGVVFLFSKRLSGFLQKHSIPFAAGVLITVSLLGLVPEAFLLIGERSLVILLISFFAAYLFEHFFLDIHHHDEDHHTEIHGKRHIGRSVPLVIVGDTIHNFIDGIAIAASFFVNPGLGFVSAFSTFLHEVPHEVGDFAILLKAGYSRKNVLLINVISASFTFAGAYVALFFAGSDIFIGVMISISAGIFLYLGAIDFLPHIETGYKNKTRAIIPLIIGVLIMLVTLMAVPHSHEEEPHSENPEHTEARF